MSGVTISEVQSVDDGSDVFWDLDPLVESLGGMRAALDTADAKAHAFAERYRGKVAMLDAAGLRELCDALADVSDVLRRAGSWASLRFSTDMTDPERGRDQQMASEKLAGLGTVLVFFELEWAAVDASVVDGLLADPVLAPYAHWLRSTRRYAPHLLSEPEERILTEKSVTGRGAWSRLFNELTGAIEVQLDGKPQTLETGLSQLQSADPAVRAEAAAAVTAALAPGLRTRAFVFNTLLADKALDDRLRSYPTWVSSMNLANEASDSSVEALVDAVQARYDLPQRWYALKARLLGVDKINDWDRMAAVTDEDQAFGWNAARELVLDAYASFSPQLADAAARFFDEQWIDAGTRPGKRGGAFCSYTVPSHHPYVFLNWTSRHRDVLTLAHELGHGLHAYLAREQTIFSQTTGLTLAETASVFGETVTFGRLLEQTTDPSARLSLLASSIEGAIATVFRQTAMNRFEAAVHTTRRERGELAVEDFNAAWRATQSEMLGDAVELSAGYDTWWSYVPHFIGSPGYVYAYAYGQLLALSVYKQYETQGSDFVPRYLHLLAAGGSQSPEDLAKIVGCDLADPGFWDGGLAIVEAQLNAAEDAAVAAGRL